MATKRLFLASLLLLISYIGLSAGQRTCLHKGCEMSGGLTVSGVDQAVSRLLKGGEFKDNVIKAVSWNIHQEETSNRYQWVTSKKDVCRFLTQLKPTFLGLQEVSQSQLNYIQSCMSGYKILKEDKFDQKKAQNIIVYKDTQRLKVRKYGSFSAEQNKIRSFNPSTCTWMKLHFGHRLTGEANSFSLNQPRMSFVERLRNMLLFLLPQKKKTTSGNRVRRNVADTYRWTNIYVAVAKINSYDETSAKQQFKSILRHMRYVVMGRRRHPLILLVDLGQEDNSAAYQYLSTKRHWLKNTMVNSIKTFPAMTLLHENDPSSEMLSDYLWQHRFHGIVSAVISDNIANEEGTSTHRPVLTTLLRYRK